MNTIQIRDDLRQRAEEVASARGATIEALVEELLEEYLEDLEDLRDIEEAQAAVERGEDELLDWESVKAEREP